MTSNGGEVPASSRPPPTSGIRTVLQYTGIPPSWFEKRPKLPSRNWLIFIGATSAIASYYYYDRRQCKRIRQEYVDKVKHLAEVPLHSLDYPRKVTVYGSKWPGDEDYDRSMKYFRKYVKPILVAAAVDYEMINGRRHGDVATRVADDIRSRRRIALGIDPPPFQPMPLPNTSPEDQRRRELEGGIILIGRPTFKEYMAGLKRGWTDSLEKRDREEELARVLASDGKFDEPETAAEDGPELDGEPIATPSRLPPSKPLGVFTPNFLPPAPASQSQSGSSIPDHLNSPPATLPPIPPLLLVSFVNHIGLPQIPHMIWEFFNERQKVRSGAEAAYKLVQGTTRPFVGPQVSSADDSDSSTFPGKPYLSEPVPSDLDFDKEAESWYKKSIARSFRADIEKAREEYYKTFPAKLEIARALARGLREPTDEEQKNPPPTEVELRAERLKKELRWRSDEQGWDIVRPDSEVEWDERFRGTLRVFTTSSSETEAKDSKPSS